MKTKIALFICFALLSVTNVLATASVLAQTGKPRKNDKPQKKDAPRTLDIIDPWNDPDRILVNILAGGAYELNDKRAADLSALESQLKAILGKRAPDHRGVLFQAPPEIRYGELVALFDVIAGAGGMPIMPLVTKIDDLVKFELIYLSGSSGAQVNLPSAAHARLNAHINEENAVVVSIPESGVYLSGDAKISSADDGYEQKLLDQILGLRRRPRLIDGSSLYVKCGKDALYSDLKPLMRAIAKAGSEQMILITEKR